MREEDSVVRPFDISEDESVVHEDEGYVCLMRCFPTCNVEEDLESGDYRRFHLRYYLPRAVIADRRRRIDRIIVMTNGFNELDSFTLYDELGSRLASQGLAAVLLPLPDHLNRHARFRVPELTYKQLTETPADILTAAPFGLYTRFIQFKTELAHLVRHLSGHKCGAWSAECSWFRDLFGPKTRISYLGYSLGAAAMLTDFLEEHRSLNACILLSGAFGLRKVKPGRVIKPDKWDALVDRLEGDFRKRNEKLGDNSTSDLFEEVFLGHYIKESSKVLRRIGRRVLFVLGAKDSVIDIEQLKTISPEKWGLGMVVLPGINHFLAFDEEWKQWIGLVTNLITSYEENASREIITRKQVLSALRSEPSSDEDRLSREQFFSRAALLGLNPDQIARDDDEKRKLRSAFLKKSKPDLLLGELLYKSSLITQRELRAALELQTRNERRLGEILVDDLKVIPQRFVDAVIREQKHWRKTRSTDDS